jgi:hypothetical protein
MAYYIDADNNYPKHDGDILAVLPEWEPGNALPDGWQEVAPGKVPTITQDQYLEELPPIQVKGKLTRQFQVVDYTPEQIEQRAAIRAEVSNNA